MNLDDVKKNKKVEVAYRVISKLSDKKRQLLDAMYKNDDYCELSIMKVLSVLRGEKYNELIENIDGDIDYEKLKTILLSSPDNLFEIKNMSDFINYQQLKNKKCDEMLETSLNSSIDVQQRLELKKRAYLYKFYGINISDAQELVNMYIEGIDKIQDKSLQTFIKSLNGILYQDEIEKLDVLNDLKSDGINVSVPLIDRKLRAEYSKIFNESYMNIDENMSKIDIKGLEGIETYDSGDKFKILLSSVAFDEEFYDEDTFEPINFESYLDEWKYKKRQSQSVCCSIIDENMMGRYPDRTVFFAFSNMNNDSLLMMASSDIKSKFDGVRSVSETQPIIFNDPQSLIDSTQRSNLYRCNELTYNAINNGEVVTPSYIVAFKSEGKIYPRVNGILKIVKDFKKNGIDLPVIIIDQDRILEKQRKEIEDYITEYNQNHNIELAFDILKKIKNFRISIDRLPYDSEKKSSSFFQNELSRLIDDTQAYMDGFNISDDRDLSGQFGTDALDNILIQKRILELQKARDIHKNIFNRYIQLIIENIQTAKEQSMNSEKTNDENDER